MQTQRMSKDLAVDNSKQRLLCDAKMQWRCLSGCCQELKTLVDQQRPLGVAHMGNKTSKDCLRHNVPRHVDATMQPMATMAAGWTGRSRTLGRLVVPLVCRNRATSSGRGGSSDGSPWGAHEQACIFRFEFAHEQTPLHAGDYSRNSASDPYSSMKTRDTRFHVSRSGAAVSADSRSMPATASSRT